MAEGPVGLSIADRLSMEKASSSGAGSGDIANEKESPEIIVEGVNKLAGTGAKLLEAIPLIGSFLAGLIPTNTGQVSAFGSIELPGLAGKSINPGKGGIQGGVLANIASALIKNSAIPGGNPYGDGSGGGGDGGNSSGQGFESFASSSGMGEMFIEAGGGNRFAVSNFDPGDLGTLSAPSFGVDRSGRGADIGIG